MILSQKDTQKGENILKLQENPAKYIKDKNAQLFSLPLLTYIICINCLQGLGADNPVQKQCGLNEHRSDLSTL